MPKLNQIVAIEDGTKKRDHKEISAIYKSLQKPDLFNGFFRTYTPINDEDIVYPAEQKNVQQKCHELLELVKSNKIELWNVIATKDYANCQAKADIVVDGVALASDVPVTHLLFLEKQLNDLKDFILKLPVLDPTKTWGFDSNKDLYVSQFVEERLKTKKIHKSVIKFEPSEHTPGDADVVTVDEPEGRWKQEDVSAAFPANKIREVMTRVTKLQEAVKFAREEANSLEVEKQKIAEGMLEYIFG